MESMTSYEERLTALMNRGEIPVFPLPNVVFFPHTSLGLHVFEPRYRRMTEDALGSDGFMAVALLKPGWESDYYGTPPVHSVACAGSIEEHHLLPDGRYNIRLRGLCRVSLTRFVRCDPYRVAAFRFIQESNGEDGPDVAAARARLLATCSGLMRELAGKESRAITLPADVPFAVGVNALCQNLAMESDRRQRLLEVDDVVERCRLLVELLSERWRDVSSGEAPSGVVH
jgi:Lon protease-like protein